MADVRAAIAAGASSSGSGGCVRSEGAAPAHERTRPARCYTLIVSSERARQVGSHLLAFAVMFPAVLHALVVLGWIAGAPLGGWLPIAALALCLAVSLALQPAQMRPALAAGLVFLVFVSAATLLSLGVADVFYDSQAYHIPAIVALSEGWNPIRDPHVCDWSRAFCLPHVGIDRYPKAAWAVSASFYALSGSFEAGKAGQLITLLGAALAAVRLLLGFRFIGVRMATAIGVAVALNPIAIKQAASAYVDGWLVSALLLLGVLLLDFVLHRRRSSLLLAAGMLPFVLNLKFTAVPFGAVLVSTACIVALRVRRPAFFPMVAWLGPAAALGLLVLGFQPYVTNTLEERNPFYPAWRVAGPDILGKMASPDFIARDRFAKFVIAQLSRGREADWREPELFVPFTGWAVTAEVDDRFSGFGEAFSAALIVGGALILVAGSEVVWLVAAGVLASLFMTEAGWWARLAPQAWWLPSLGVVAGMLPGRRKVVRGLASLLALIVACIILSTIAATALHALESTAGVEAALHGAAEGEAVIVPDRDSGVMRSAFSLTLRQRLRDAGQRVRVVQEPPRTCASEYAFTGATLCVMEPARRQR